MDIFAYAIKQTLADMRNIAHIFGYVWFFVLPPMLFYLFKDLWMYYVNNKYWGTMDWLLLEIIPPKNIERSPKPMEALFVGMAGVEKGFNVLEKYVQGAYADSFSLEIVSDGGEMHFYIRTRKNFRHLVEAHLYAQYPDIVINAVPDYVDEVPKIVPNAKWNLWGSDLEFVKHNAFPLRTYQHFEESVTGKMIDPLAGLAETMSKLIPGQKIWLQFVISPYSPSWTKDNLRAQIEKMKGNEPKVTLSLIDRLWTDILDIFSNLYKALSEPVQFADPAKKDQQPLEFRLSPKEREILKEVEEKAGKLMFRTKIRLIYLGKRDGYDKSLGVSAIMGAMKQFNDDNLNGLKPNDESKTYANFVYTKPRERYRQRKLLRRYRSRNSDGALVALNTEELATLFHLPDMQVVAPSLARTEAKRGGAPVNLPVD